MGWMHDGGVFFQLVTIKLLYALVLNRNVYTLSIFDVLDPDCIWISLEAIFFLCQSLFAWSFSGFEFWSSSKLIFYLPQSLCKNLGRFLSYEVHHRSHCFVCHSFCLLNHFETPQSFYLPVSISKFLSRNVFQSSCLLVSVPKFMSPMFVSKSCPLVCLKAFVYHCVSKFLSACVCFKVLVYQLCVSKLLSTSICVKVFVD